MSYLWLFYALLSAVFAALVAIFGKIGLKDLDTNTATAIRAIIMALFLVAVIIVQGKWNQVEVVLSNHKALLFIILSGLAGAVSWLFYFLALKKGSVSQIVPIDRLSIVFALVFALIFLGERINLTKGIGALIVLIGAVLVALG